MCTDERVTISLHTHPVSVCTHYPRVCTPGKKSTRVLDLYVAEGEGFEPSIPFNTV